MEQDTSRGWQDDPLWYKDAIIYELHVRAFYDSNDDGIGDFKGLTQRLDYLQDLGINTIWLLPFYPSPMRDDGYDIADYRNIHPDYGTRRDFALFVREAHRRGLKVITELVINHTSDQHPWFQAARRAPPGSAKRDYYVWSTTKKKFEDTRIIFTDTENSNWAWDDEAKAYYWHRFFSHQPDLNHNNPQVVNAMIRVMQFWLDLGVDGLRLDAIPYLCVREGTTNENLPETHAVIKRMRAVVDAHYKNRLFLAEANQWPEDVHDYFGDGDECHMAYHFPLMPRMYMALAQEDRHPIVEILHQTPDVPDNCQWAIFLRNHDELTLEMVTDRERDYMYQAYAAEKRMRVNVGIRRRLAPLMDNDPDKVKLMVSMLMSMPGSPILYYGDEIGMGDNIYLGDRNGVRTPMQWSLDRNAGFSRADPQQLYLPPIMDPIFGYQAVNVEAQTRSPSSLLNWNKRIIAVRKAHPAFSRGTLEFLHPGNRKIFAYLRHWKDDWILCVCNLSHTAQPVELDLGRFKGRVPVEMLGRIPFPPIGDLPYLLTLSPYGVYWFLLASEAAIPLWHEEALPPLGLPVLVLFKQWQSFMPDQVPPARRDASRRLRQQLEAELLPAVIANKRWFAGKGRTIDRVDLTATAAWPAHAPYALLATVRLWQEQGPEDYFFPLSILWEDQVDDWWPLLHHTLAKVRHGARVGILFDAFADERFPLDALRAFARGEEAPFGEGTLAFTPTRVFADLYAGLGEEPTVRRPLEEGTNTAVIIGEHFFLKAYRRLQSGISPEVEMGRFLTEESPFAHIIPVAGVLEYRPLAQGEPTALALLQGYVGNQGDGWHTTLGYLDRFLDHYQLQDEPAQDAEEIAREHVTFTLLMRTLGQRTGELHVALALTTGNPAFDPEPLTVEAQELWQQHLSDDLHGIVERLQREPLPEANRDLVAQLLDHVPELRRRLGAWRPVDTPLLTIRIHGDYHLGQVLVVENDFVIIDFEGEPNRPMQQRRAKNSALRDVAGMLRSFSYAGYTALSRVTANRPDDWQRLEPLVRQWEALSAQAFLEGYQTGIGDCPIAPMNAEEAYRLRQLFQLEKALYELRYELDHRPEWLSIPIRGLLRWDGQRSV